jgi:hypothetical protein
MSVNAATSGRYRDARLLHLIDRGAWDEPLVRDAVKRTGRQKLLIAGITTPVCLNVRSHVRCVGWIRRYALLDTLGTWSDLLRLTSSGRVGPHIIGAVEIRHDRDAEDPRDTGICDDIVTHLIRLEISNAWNEPRLVVDK